MSEHSMNDSEANVSEDNTYRNRLDFYTCQWYLSKMANNVLILFIFCHFVYISVLSKYAIIIHVLLVVLLLLHVMFDSMLVLLILCGHFE